MIHPTAIVDCEIGKGTMVFAFSHLLAGAKVGRNVKICDHVFVEGGATIGDNVTVKNGVSVWEGVVIEDDVFVGPNATFTNDQQPRSPRMPGAVDRYADKQNWLAGTRVGQGATIGANATILPGLNLGKHCFVAAGSVVTKSVPPYTLVMGSPARQHASVCSCGHRLADHYSVSTCDQCGESPSARTIDAVSESVR